jgi:hypothetical protein
LIRIFFSTSKKFREKISGHGNFRENFFHSRKFLIKIFFHAQIFLRKKISQRKTTNDFFSQAPPTAGLEWLPWQGNPKPSFPMEPFGYLRIHTFFAPAGAHNSPTVDA